MCFCYCDVAKCPQNTHPTADTPGAYIALGSQGCLGVTSLDAAVEQERVG